MKLLFKDNVAERLTNEEISDIENLINRLDSNRIIDYVSTNINHISDEFVDNYIDGLGYSIIDNELCVDFFINDINLVYDFRNHKYYFLELQQNESLHPDDNVVFIYTIRAGDYFETVEWELESDNDNYIKTVINDVGYDIFYESLENHIEDDVLSEIYSQCMNLLDYELKEYGLSFEIDNDSIILCNS